MRSLIFISIVFYCVSAQTDFSKKKDSIPESWSAQVEEKPAFSAASDSQRDTIATVTLKNETTEVKKDAVAEENKRKTASPLPPSTKQQAEGKLKSLKETLASVNTSVELGLEYPLSFGAHGKFHIGESMYSRLGVGFASELLVTAFSKIAPSLGYLNRQEANLISDVIQNSFFWGLAFGMDALYKKIRGALYGIGAALFDFWSGRNFRHYSKCGY